MVDKGVRALPRLSSQVLTLRLVHAVPPANHQLESRFPYVAPVLTIIRIHEIPLWSATALTIACLPLPPLELWIALRPHVSS